MLWSTALEEETAFLDDAVTVPDLRNSEADVPLSSPVVG